MNFRELDNALNDLEELYDDDLVMIKLPTGGLYSVKGISREPQSTDEGGNVTSTGATVWIEAEPF